MKKNLLLSFSTLLFFSIVWMGHNNGEGKISGKDRTGSPLSDGTCAKSGCHNGGSFNASTNITLTNNQGTVVNKYKAGNTYEVKVNVTGTGAAGYGFMLTALTSAHTMAGSFSNAPVAQIIQIGNVSYVEQAFQNTSGQWKFSWTAPSTNSGVVKFYACGLACDNSKSSGGDQAAPLVKSLEETTATYEIAKTFSVKLDNVIKDQLNVELKTTDADHYTFDIISLNGNIKLSEKKFIESGSNHVNFNTNNLAHGLYVLSISKSDGDKLLKKFVVN